MATYRDRNRILAELGFPSYGVYLKSDLWASIRARVYAKIGRNPKCSICPSPSEHLHHTHYSRQCLSGQSLYGIVPVCGRCHSAVEFDSKNQKRTLAKAQRAYLDLKRMVRIGAKKRCKKCGALKNRFFCRNCQRRKFRDSS